MTTSTDPTDQVEVPHLKERLWQELVQLHAESGPASADTETDTDTGAGIVTLADAARRQARRSLRLGVAAAAAAVVVVVAVGVQLVGTGGPTDDELLVQRVVAATEDAADASVVHSVTLQSPPGGGPAERFDTWHDEQTGIARMYAYDAQGNASYEVGPLTAPTLADPGWSGQRVVTHCAQTYVDHTDTGGASIELPAGTSDFRDLVADGTVVEDGTEVFEGRDVIRLQGVDFVLLADPDTYRIVAQRGTLDLGETYTSTYEYTPRTDASLAALVPAPPVSYTAAPPGPVDACLGLPTAP